jgi:hypothetical protein
VLGGTRIVGPSRALGNPSPRAVPWPSRAAAFKFAAVICNLNEGLGLLVILPRSFVNLGLGYLTGGGLRPILSWTLTFVYFVKKRVEAIYCQQNGTRTRQQERCSV